MTYDPQELPWNEDKWERFMRKSDAQAARYGDLLETLIDHPNRDQIIAREMGWDDEPSSETGTNETVTFDAEPSHDEQPGMDSTADENSDDEDDFRTIPVYQAAFEWGIRVHDVLKEHLEAEEELEPDNPLLEAYSNSLQVAAKIAGGHGIGYDEESICGNIVCCKIALKAANDAVVALAEVRSSGQPNPKRTKELVQQGNRVCELVADRIEELRAQVWWQ